MPIEPDTKDWTWVLDRKCDECGFDAGAFPRDQVSRLIRENTASWREVLENPDVARRPTEDRWSALEYACHVRDVFRLYAERLHMMLERDDPDYPNWDQNEAAIDGRYAEADPAEVADEIESLGAAVAAGFDRVGSDDWARTGNRSDGARFTVESFARYFVHDPIHHLHDVRLGYELIGVGE